MDIQGFENYQITKDGRVYNKLAKEFMKGWTNKLGYRFVQLSDGGKSKRFPIHRLVSQAYIPNPNNYPHVNHKDSDTGNNEWTNLEWVTPRLNALHSIAKGRHMAAKNRKLTEEMRRDIVMMRRNGMTGVEIAKKVGVSSHCIYQFLGGRSYTSVRNEISRIRK